MTDFAPMQMTGDQPAVKNFNWLMTNYGPAVAYNYMGDYWNVADWRAALDAQFGVAKAHELISYYGPSGAGYLALQIHGAAPNTKVTYTLSNPKRTISITLPY